MNALATIADRFHDACMGGEGWEACQRYCLPDATFSHEGSMLADCRTVEAYTEHVKAMLTPIPNLRREVRAIAVDEDRSQVIVHYLMKGTHTDEGAPHPPTGKGFASNSVLVFEFEGDLIRHVTKVWNDGYTLQQIGWLEPYVALHQPSVPGPPLNGPATRAVTQLP